MSGWTIKIKGHLCEACPDASMLDGLLHKFVSEFNLRGIDVDSRLEVHRFEQAAQPSQRPKRTGPEP